MATQSVEEAEKQQIGMKERPRTEGRKKGADCCRGDDRPAGGQGVCKAAKKEPRFLLPLSPRERVSEPAKKQTSLLFV